VERYDIVLSGLGGQGVMTVSHVLALAASREGIPVKMFEGTGIAQRGGGVFGFVRLGEAHSPRIPMGRADTIIGLEISEVLGVLSYLKDDGEVWVSSRRVDGYHTKLCPSSYPSREKIEAAIRGVTPHLHIIPAEHLAQEAGSPRSVNMVMVGVFVSAEKVLTHDSIAWAIQRVSRKFASSNLRAFWEGSEFVSREGVVP
jgi:indolepyruvate ferredoxin oxidoreductase beta subunit